MGGDRTQGAAPAVGSFVVVSSVWLNGAMLEPSTAMLSVFDHGTTVGDGVFETMLAYPDTGISFCADHLRRLRASAAGLFLEVPYDDDTLVRAINEVVASETSGDANVRVRLTVTGGAGPLGSDRGGATPTVIVTQGTKRYPIPAQQLHYGFLKSLLDGMVK